MKKIKRAISIRQPWAHEILSGRRDIEYRSQPTNIRERVYVYVSCTKDMPCDFQTGAIFGSVEITDCYLDDFNQVYCYILKNPKRFSKPLMPKNHPQPRFWRPQL